MIMSTEEGKPKVLIVGAGIGGLLLGALLEKAEIPYEIFERTSVVKPLGRFFFVVPVLRSFVFSESTFVAKNTNSCPLTDQWATFQNLNIKDRHL
jgi:hypothetical protein